VPKKMMRPSTGMEPEVTVPEGVHLLTFLWIIVWGALILFQVCTSNTKIFSVA
jgi:hypothetical protein